MFLRLFCISFLALEYFWDIVVLSWHGLADSHSFQSQSLIVNQKEVCSLQKTNFSSTPPFFLFFWDHFLTVSHPELKLL